MRNTLLGGFSPAQFLRRFWQKQPLLVRGAVPGFPGLLERRQLFELARREDCESRLVIRSGRHWHVEHGPLPARASRDLPARGWTLLVQGVDQFLPAARDLLSRFDFIPHARLDDLMISYAPPGGGVGPHLDSYDVFLLQGPGQRRWRIGRQHDQSLVEDAPLKILKRFRPQGEAVLGPGDMLYLPPGIAHDGTAVTDCFTYSIGFRAPRFEELKTHFLAYLDDVLRLDGIYGDPDLKPARHPGVIDQRFIERIARCLGAIRWNRTLVRDFAGTYLTEPKGHVRFSPPARVETPAGFLRAARRRGVELAPASLLLVASSSAYMNGEKCLFSNRDRGAIVRLSDTRRLTPGFVSVSAGSAALLYRWYREGYIRLS